MKLIKEITDVLQGKATLTQKRSSKWGKIRKEFLKKNSKCNVCGEKKKLEIHHIRPFNLHPELELEEHNLISLCESRKGGIVCHLAIGHLGSYRSYNKDVRLDAENWHNKIINRPK